jgi:predicted ATP-dependent endonuclease of OLD family
MTFDVRPARPVIRLVCSRVRTFGAVFDDRHQVTTELGSRSRGFIWFFSFLAWYSDVKKNARPMILLLDEPGLTLHAKAQRDLLRYFETELKGSHQLIYSTHSPFMIDPSILSGFVSCSRVPSSLSFF